MVGILKAEKSYREVGIPPTVAVMLQSWIQHKDCCTLANVMRREKLATKLVFPSKKGGVMADSNFARREFRDAKTLAVQLDPTFPTAATIHSMRHHFATAMLMAGMDYYDLAAQMGHESITTTYEYGAYVFSKKVPASAAKLNKSIAKAAQSNAQVLQQLPRLSVPKKRRGASPDPGTTQIPPGGTP